MRTRWFARYIAAGLLLSACSSDDGGSIQSISEDGASIDASEDIEADVPDGAEPDGEPEDPFALPDEIDQEYVQRAVDELMAIRTDAIRMAVEANLEGEGSLEEPTLVIGSIATGPELLEGTQMLAEIARGSNIDEVYRAPEDMEDDQLRVLDVLIANHDCTAVTGRFDLSGSLNDDPAAGTIYAVVLSRDIDDELPNDTFWKLREVSGLIDDSSGEPATPERVEGLTPDGMAGIVDVTCGEGGR